MVTHEKVENCLESNKDNPNFGYDFVNSIAFFTIPLSMFIGFLTRFNPKLQDTAFRELKIGPVVSVCFFIVYSPSDSQLYKNM